MWSKSAGSGVSVVLVHGALCDYRWWEPQLDALAQGWQVIAVSLDGFYPTPALSPDAFSSERHAAALAAFLDTFQTPVHLVGHSRGGRIALHAATRMKRPLRSLVLIEPGGEIAPGFLPASAPAATSSSAADLRTRTLALVQAGDAEAAMRLYIDGGHGEGRWDRLAAPVRQIIVDNAGTIAGMVRDRSGAFTAETARAIACPTLLMVGAASPPIFGRIVDALETYVPSHERQTVPEADHFLTWDKAAAVNAALIDWLRRHAGR